MSHDAYDRSVLRSQIDIVRRAAATREKLEQEIAAEWEAETSAARREADAAVAAARQKAERESAALKSEHVATKQKAETDATAARTKLDAERSKLLATIKRTWENDDRQLKEDAQFDDGSSKEVFKERRKEPGKILHRAEKELATAAEQLAEADSRSISFLAGCGVTAAPATQPPVAAAAEGVGDGASGGEAAAESATPAADVAHPAAAAAPSPPLPTGSAILAHMEQLRAAVADGVKTLLGLKSVATAYASGTKAAAVVLPILFAIIAGAGAFFLAPGALPEAAATKGIAAGGTFAAVAGIGVGIGLWLVARMRRAARAQAEAARADLAATIQRAHDCLTACGRYVKARHKAQLAKLDETFAQESAERRRQSEAAIKAVADKRDKQLAEVTARHAAATEAIQKKIDTLLAAADAKFPPRLAEVATARAAEEERRIRERDARLEAAEARRASRWAEMTEAWKGARSGVADVCARAAAVDAASFPAWDDLAGEGCDLPVVAPPALRFGHVDVSLEKMPGGVSKRPELNAFGPVSWTEPALVPFPVEASILVKTVAEQKEVASALMQALMLRIASGIPAGQSRFTIVDPAGLGKQFAGFMHLADYDELLVTSRIWTEPPQIDQCLGDITEQIEVVIQKYLRNEYESIGAYNADAEVPEPYRFVVVANFPTNFTETAARRLASIAASGPRCGVYTIVSVDEKQTMPANFSLSDLEKNATTLVLKNGTFTWNDPEFSRWPLTVEEPPSDETFTRIIQRVGKAAKAAKRVEVPFDRVAPKEEDWWTASSASEVTAPLGPAGAKKLQFLKLGRGTSQHALIAGKTGSGKSTLMHALITSLALNYSPNEIQFYLIDFKKGVEFKLYDHYKLPHARVIAIESEREFGLSVMEQLDRELKRRGDLFRELSVQDVAGFRKTGHADPMPRILLVIDEFQEIFVEDDKIAQDAALILDRLVRQGRAFGMHVLLGSQTLGGSYSLPRATMGQMAIRIALQCNEADSALILSEDNTAARLLTRPGEAIYNDANGMVAGNNPFQVVFLNDERRERYLGALRRLADRRTDIPALPRIVFDGNEAADPAGNALLAELLHHGTVHGKPPAAPQAWLGDAIAIKDPTAAIFRRQGGANLLIVGQREDLGVSLLAMSMLSLAAAHDPHPGGATGRAARFVLFEPAIAEEKPDTMLARLVPHMPHETEIVGRLGVAEAMERLAGEVRRRLDEQVTDAEGVFVIVRDLARFRELRRNESDFGFSMGGEQKATPAQNLVTLLKDGPTVGVHLLIWCDSLTNLQRTFERGTLKEFELRVLFQMSSSDSSQLVDSPAAVKLGPQRALFIHEETGTLEKFRPYAFPGGEWLDGLSATLRGRPQGTPVERPVAVSREATATRHAGATDDANGDAASSGEFGGFKASFTNDEFNFAKFLDDPPAEGPARGDPPSPAEDPPA